MPVIREARIPAWQMFSMTIWTIPAAMSFGLGLGICFAEVGRRHIRFRPGSFSLAGSPIRRSIFATSPLRDRGTISWMSPVFSMIEDSPQMVPPLSRHHLSASSPSPVTLTKKLPVPMLMTMTSFFIRQIIASGSCGDEFIYLIGRTIVYRFLHIFASHAGDIDSFHISQFQIILIQISSECTERMPPGCLP